MLGYVFAVVVYDDFDRKPYISVDFVSPPCLSMDMLQSQLIFENNNCVRTILIRKLRHQKICLAFYWSVSVLTVFRIPAAKTWAKPEVILHHA